MEPTETATQVSQDNLFTSGLEGLMGMVGYRLMERIDQCGDRQVRHALGDAYLNSVNLALEVAASSKRVREAIVAHNDLVHEAAELLFDPNSCAAQGFRLGMLIDTSP